MLALDDKAQFLICARVPPSLRRAAISFASLPVVHPGIDHLPRCRSPRYDEQPAGCVQIRDQRFQRAFSANRRAAADFWKWALTRLARHVVTSDVEIQIGPFAVGAAEVSLTPRVVDFIRIEQLPQVDQDVVELDQSSPIRISNQPRLPPRKPPRARPA